MESSEYIRSKLSNYTTAVKSEEDVKNNRYHYTLYFEEDIGWDWLQGEVRKLSKELEANLEMWKLRPAPATFFVVEVREIDRRRGIDNSQSGLQEFEKE